MKNKLFHTFVAISLLLSPAIAWNIAKHALSQQEGKTRLIPFQGHLTRPVPENPQQFEPVPDGQYDILFTLYATPAGGESKIWGPERHQTVMVVSGLVNVLIGSVISLEDVSPEKFSLPIYVGITVDADRNALTPDLELVPRQVLIPAIYAYDAGNSRLLSGYGWESILYKPDPLNPNPATGTLRGEVPIGTIMSWAGNPAELRTKYPQWRLCDGSAVNDVESIFNGKNLPNLKGRFIKGEDDGGHDLRDLAFNSYLVNTHSHAVKSVESAGSHNHPGVANGSTLTADQMPVHTHTYSDAYYCENDPDVSGTTHYGSHSSDEDNDRFYYRYQTDGSAPDTGGAGGRLVADPGHMPPFKVETQPHSHGLSIDTSGAHAHTVTIDSTSSDPINVELHYIMRIK
jgi:hypothetical protein